ncbi:MAG TPA: tyrosine-type recombinase/integrase [Vicinamibacterales bacterium]
MPVHHLTDRTIAALPVPSESERQRDYWDDVLRGFGVRVSYGGKRAFVVRYRVGRRLRRLTIGPYPVKSLADARKEARSIIGQAADGDDPAQTKQEQLKGELFRDLATAYVEMAEKRHRSWREEKRIIDKDLLPVLGFRRLADIRRRDVRELVEAIARKRDAPIMANRTLGVLCRMFNFALDREWIEANPASRIPEPGEEKSRDRVLSDEELRELWAVLESLAKDYEEEADDSRQKVRPAKARVTPATAQAFQVQLLTAQRPGETCKMRWADVDLESGWWTIPAPIAKNGRAHRVPLTKPVIEILERRRELAGDSAKIVFENRRGAGSIAHRAKKAASILCRGLSFEFRAHDLRRTASTGMAEAGVPRDHIAKVLNHVEGGPAATRVYDRYAYDKEKRDALERWARRLQAIIEGKTAKVMSIRRA